MREPEEKREEKLEGHEIRLGGGVGARVERPHGKLYRWFDNFWYHHKWKTIIISFFLIVFIVCTVQMCNKDPETDVNILIAGPTNFAGEPGGTGDLEALLAGYVTTDYNEDGRKDVDIRHYTVFSEEQIKTLEAVELEGGQALYVDRSVSSSNYSNFYSYLSTGEAAILILDRWAFDKIREDGLLVDLSSQLENAPTGAIFDGDGSNSYYGINLKETDLYNEQIAFRVLEEEYIEAEPVICMLSKLVTTNDEKYDIAMDYFKSLVG
ncbi:MAG: hypothetical protein IJY22_00785 [Clostridia bacterium]|nr:hypothetical protein [Clostridia bacterium]